jgi:hypothetical protein
VLSDILLRGVKKFRELILVHPNVVVISQKRDRGFPVLGVVNDDIWLVHLVFCLKIL